MYSYLNQWDQDETYDCYQKGGVLVLPAQNAIKMQGWQKGKFVLLWIRSWGQESRELLSKGCLPALTVSDRDTLYPEGGGYTEL